jgi:hypothetical protein
VEACCADSHRCATIGESVCVERIAQQLPAPFSTETNWRFAVYSWIFRYPNMRRWNWLECLAVAVLLATGGCARPAETVPVHGTVLYRGQPLQTGVVAFVSDPQRHSQHVLAVAKLQPDGHFSVEWEGREGIPPGWYRISVICPDARGWPDKYCDPDRSGLECQILPQQTNMLVIRLE